MLMEHILRKLEHFIEEGKWAGWDPYDGLNSPFLRMLTLQRKWLRIAAIQFMKRSPINLRSVLNVRESRNPKAMALIVRAYLARYKETGKSSYLNKVREILDWLVANSCAGYQGYAWGHNFDWQSSIFYVPKGVPTVVNTSFVGQAFIDGYKILKEKTYLDVARSSCDFVLNDLSRTTQDGKVCFSYSPIDKLCVHNANLLGAELLAQVYSIIKEENLLTQAKSAVDFTMAYQNPNGSWYYGMGSRQRYIDSFHTGFILVSLKNILGYLDYPDDSRFKRILLKGYEYYKRTFFDNNGMPYYYHDKTYPIDLHCSAQGIITFLKFSEYDNGAINMAKKIATWAIENMWDNKGQYFYFQKTKHFTNKVRYLRWPNAWMFYALAKYRDFACRS